MNAGKVHFQDEVLVALRSRMAADIEIAKQFVETILHVDVVIVGQHGECQRLAEASGTDEEEILVGLLDLFDKSRLVHEVTVVSSQPSEVHHAIRDALRFLPLFLSVHLARHFVSCRKDTFFREILNHPHAFSDNRSPADACTRLEIVIHTIPFTDLDPYDPLQAPV